VAFCATGEHRFSRTVGDAQLQEARGCGFRQDGHFWVGGDFEGDLDLGGSNPLTATVVDRRVFLARFDPAGGLSHQTAIGDDNPLSSSFSLSNLAVGPDDSVVLVGTFDGEISACPSPLVSSATAASIFVMRLDQSGVCTWGTIYEGSRFCETDNAICPWPFQAAVSPTGEVAIAGGFYEWVDWGDGQRTGPADAPQTFVVHHAADGQLIAGHVNTQTTAWAVPSGVGFSGDRIIVGGIFSASGSATAATISFGGNGMSTNTEEDLFVAGIGADDVWERSIGAAFRDWSEALAVDPDGDIVVAVSFIGEDFNFGSGPIDNTNPSPGVQFDLALGKLSGTDGSALWSPLGFGPMEAIELSPLRNRIAADAVSNVVVAGRLREKDVSFGGYDVPSQPDNNFLFKLNREGSVLWANAFGILDPPAAEPWPFRIARVAGGPTGQIGLCGFTTNSLDFGGGTLAVAGGRDAVFAVFAP
jgi:hypothetical protein